MAYLDYLADVFRHDRARRRTFGVRGTFEVERMLMEKALAALRRDHVASSLAQVQPDFFDE